MTKAKKYKWKFDNFYFKHSLCSFYINEYCISADGPIEYVLYGNNGFIGRFKTLKKAKKVAELILTG